MKSFNLAKEDKAILFNGKNVFIAVEFYSGERYNNCKYDELEIISKTSYRGVIEVVGEGGSCCLVDTWKMLENSICLRREICLKQTSEDMTDGVWISLGVPLTGDKWDYFMPAGCYKECPAEREGKGVTLMEERLPYPLVLAYDNTCSQGLMLIRVNPATWSEIPQRIISEQSFLHSTDLGGLGFQRGLKGNDSALVACLPYEETPTSRTLDRDLRPIRAYLPLNCERLLEVNYELKVIDTPEFDDACLEAFSYAFSLQKPEPVKLPFTLSKAVRYRVESLVELVREWDGYTGLALNFDPQKGVNTPPRGFGRAFNKIESNLFPQILEYGFTGRQVNNAYMLIILGKRWNRPDWVERGVRIVESFINHCTHETGFLYTLFDVKGGNPLQPLGDKLGAFLHYGIKDTAKGNYLRNMSEAAYDILLCSEITGNKKWQKVVLNFGKFLITIQNKDGSWYRAYTPQGKPITEPEEWFGRTAMEQKTSTSVPIYLLVHLHRLAPEEGFLSAAKKAGEWVLNEMVDRMNYRGGTLDNANVIDKEAMGIVLAGLMALYEQTGEMDYLKGAKKAGGLALTWNYIWDVLFEPGTRLYEHNFRTRGWGGIDILWAGSVVDIYSLSFCRDWFKLTELTCNPIFKEVARLVLNGTQQLLSYPGNHYGLIATGMQEEGFACSSLGMDEGLIKKGDTWGSLGWIYATGTYDVLRVLLETDTLE